MREHIRQMLSGPGTLRFIVQPTLAVLVGVWHGRRDARVQRAPFLAGLIRSRGRRVAWLLQTLQSIALPLTLALVASVVFQYVIRSHVRPSYALLYAATFVAVPYLLTRSLTNRVVRATRRPRLPRGPAQPVT
jgi:hypothetical protein